jgi:hypothetical protein
MKQEFLYLSLCLVWISVSLMGDLTEQAFLAFGCLVFAPI